MDAAQAQLLIDGFGTIGDTLAELRNQNSLLAAANNDSKTAAADKAAEENIRVLKREWVNDEALKVDKCEGLPLVSIRTWLRAMKEALGRVPTVAALDPAQIANVPAYQLKINRDLGKKLMIRTSRGALVNQIDKAWSVNENYTPMEVLGEIESTFLGADEPAALRSELEELRQQNSNKPEHQIPAYCRLFLEKADEAYGIIDRAEDTEAKLAELFVTSLSSEDIAREIFEHDPPLETLAEVQERATAIFNRTRRMSRAWKGRRKAPVRRETPMEIGQIDSSTEQALLARITKLESELAASKSKVPAKAFQPKKSQSSYTGPRTAGPKSACYECGQLGHFGRDCPQRAARMQVAAASGTE